MYLDVKQLELLMARFETVMEGNGVVNSPYVEGEFVCITAYNSEAVKYNSSQGKRDLKFDDITERMFVRMVTLTMEEQTKEGRRLFYLNKAAERPPKGERQSLHTGPRRHWLTSTW